MTDHDGNSLLASPTAARQRAKRDGYAVSKRSHKRRYGPHIDAAADTFELRSGSSSALIAPSAGGRLGQLNLGRGSVLRGWSAGLGWTEWGSYPLLPWSNRIPGGHLDLGGAHADLATNWPDGSAIHGLAAARPWQVVTRTDGTATLSLDIDVAPWCLAATQHFTLRAGQLDEEVIVENVGGDTVPIGLGIHPWFRAGLLLVPADMKWPGDPLPVGPPIPVESHDDLRRGMVPPVMDRCFTGLTGSHVDVPGVRLRWEGPITHVVVYTGEPGWAAVEPVTMANDGFGLAARGIAGHGVILIDPGTKVRVAYSFTALTPEERSSG